MLENTLQSPAEFLKTLRWVKRVASASWKPVQKKKVLKKKKDCSNLCSPLSFGKRRTVSVHSQAFLQFVYQLLSCLPYATPLRELLKTLSLVLQKNDCISFKADLGLSNVIHLGVFPCFFFPSVKSSLARQGLCTESRTEGT